MFASELFDHVDLPVETIAEIKSDFINLWSEINTQEDMQYFLTLQESFDPSINKQLEDCYVMIMSADLLGNVGCSHSGAMLMYSRNQLTKNHLVMIAREILAEMSAEAVEALIFHELVHKDQDLRGDLVLNTDHLVWKGEAKNLMVLGNEMQLAAERYSELEVGDATLLAICETMPWECEAYAKMYEYAKRLGCDTTWKPEIMDRVVAIYHRMFA